MDLNSNSPQPDSQPQSQPAISPSLNPGIPSIQDPETIEGLAGALTEQRALEAVQIPPAYGTLSRRPSRYIRSASQPTPELALEGTMNFYRTPANERNPDLPRSWTRYTDVHTIPVYEGETDDDARRRAMSENLQHIKEDVQFFGARYLDEVTFNISRHLWTDDFERGIEDTHNPEEVKGLEMGAWVTSIGTMVGMPAKTSSLTRAVINPAGEAITGVFNLGKRVGVALSDSFLSSAAGAPIASRLQFFRQATNMGTWARKTLGKLPREADLFRAEVALKRVGGEVLKDGSIYIPKDADPTLVGVVKGRFKELRASVGMHEVPFRLVRNMSGKTVFGHLNEMIPVIAGGAAAGGFVRGFPNFVGSQLAPTYPEQAAYREAILPETTKGLEYGGAAGFLTKVAIKAMGLQKPDFIEGEMPPDRVRAGRTEPIIIPKRLEGPQNRLEGPK